MIRTMLKSFKRNKTIVFYIGILTALFTTFILALQVRNSIYKELDLQYCSEEQRQFVVTNKIYDTNSKDWLQDKKIIESINHIQKTMIVDSEGTDGKSILLIEVDSLRNRDRVEKELKKQEISINRVMEGAEKIVVLYQKIDYFLSIIIMLLSVFMIMYIFIYVLSIMQEEKTEFMLLYTLGYTKGKILIIKILCMMIMFCVSYGIAVLLTFLLSPIINLVMETIQLKFHVYMPIVPLVMAILIMGIITIMVSCSKYKLENR